MSAIIAPLSAASFTQACIEMVNTYVAEGQAPVRAVGMTAHRTAHTGQQLVNLTVRAGKARRAMQIWQQRGRALYLGKYLYTADIAGHFESRVPVHCLDFASEPDEAAFAALCADLRDCVVIVNGNDFGDLRLLQRLYNQCPDTLFIATLYDNHHALEMCVMLSLCTDMVFPAHYDYLALLNRYSPFLRGPLPASAIQWSARQARALAPLLYSTARDTGLSGGFTAYPQFPFRNEIVRTAMRQPVGAALELPLESSGQHHSVRSKEENWAVWCGSKVNLVVPTLTDLPHRFFDALLTGNIPLVPRYLEVFFSHFDFSGFSQAPVVWFDYADLNDLGPLVRRAVAMFDAAGKNGIAQRHRWVLEQHMMEHRLERILDDVARLTAAHEGQA